MAAAHAYVPHVSRLDNVMQGLHYLLEWRVTVETVALQYVDVIELEAFERFLHRVKNMLQRGALALKIPHVDNEMNAIHLAAETMLVHVSYLVELSVWFRPRYLFHRFPYSAMNLYDGISPGFRQVVLISSLEINIPWS